MGCALEFGLYPHGLFIKNIVILEVDSVRHMAPKPKDTGDEDPLKKWTIIIYTTLKKNASLNVQTISFL